MKEAMGCGPTLEFDKNIVYGFFNRKGFIMNDTKWFFLCSECNLSD